MAGFIPPEKLEQIRAASDIIDVIGAAIPLKRAGANFVALCPFHREKSPSFNVNPHRQIFHCFGCHKGGDVFSFIREYENLSFVDAVKRLADRANIPLEFENQPGQRESRAVKDTLLQMHEQIARRWQTALANDPAGQIARDYLAKRGVAPEAIELFRLGFAPEAWDDTVNWSKSKGYDLALVEQAGLIIRKEESDRFYDRFRGRLMFPICDEQGRVIAFSGRVLSGDEKTAKYVNSPETPIFTKGKVFYGLDKSKRAILDAGFAIICEGQLDLIACYMAGVKNIVAPQGTAFTGDHARVLKRYVDEVVLCFDSDNAGQNAAVRVLDTLLGAGLAIRVATVPIGHDPDSFIKQHGGEEFDRLIKSALNFPEFFLGMLCKENDITTDKGRLAVLKGMGELLKKFRNPVLVPKYSRLTAERLMVSNEIVRREFDKYVRQGFGGGPSGVLDVDRESSRKIRGRETGDKQQETTDHDVTAPSEREYWLLRFLLLHEEQMDWVVQHLDLGWLEHATIKRILAARLAAHSSHNWRGVPGLIDDLDDPAAGALISRAAATEQNKEIDMGRNIVEAIRLLRNDHFDRQLATLKLRLAAPGLSETDTVQILREQADIRRARQQPFG